MNQPEIPREPEGGPPFAEPWHGLVFSLTTKMAQAGHFTWPEWTDRFATNLASTSAAGAPKDASRYYDVWLATFEELLQDRGLASAEDLRSLKNAWAQAYLRTPHGEPVVLPRNQQRRNNGICRFVIRPAGCTIPDRNTIPARNWYAR